MRRALISLGLAFALVAASCGDDDEPVSSGGPDSEEPVSDDETSEPAGESERFVGTVTDETGAPVAGAAFEIISKDGYPVPEIAVVTDATGSFEGPPLPAGDYTLNVTAEGFQAATQDAAIVAGEATTVDIVLQQ